MCRSQGAGAFPLTTHLGLLQAKLNQPGPWLKEVVNDIAVLNRSGPNLGKYELKPDYQADT